MPLYIADFLKKTTHLGAIETGAYLLLIMDYWQNGKLPGNDRLLARIAKLTDREWKGLRPILQGFFHDGWKHERIDEEIAHAADVSEKRKKAVSTREQKKHQADITSGSNDTSDDDTLHTTQSKEEAAGAAPYAFESGPIKLNQRDFEQWNRAFSHLDLPAELLSLTEWASQQRSWFNAVKGALAKRNREVKAAGERDAPAPFKWNGIEGVI